MNNHLPLIIDLLKTISPGLLAITGFITGYILAKHYN